MTKLPFDMARCNAGKKCPSRDRCLRYLDRPDVPGLYLSYAAWEARIEPGADRCDGFLPAEPVDPSVTF